MTGIVIVTVIVIVFVIVVIVVVIVDGYSAGEQEAGKANAGTDWQQIPAGWEGHNVKLRK